VGKWFGVIAKWFVRCGVKNEEETRKPCGARSSARATRARQRGQAEGGEWRGKRSESNDEFWQKCQGLSGLIVVMLQYTVPVLSLNVGVEKGWRRTSERASERE